MQASRANTPWHRLTHDACEALCRRQRKQTSAPTVKQHLAAIRHLFDWLVTGQIVPHMALHMHDPSAHAMSSRT
jgi:site-specific recombinase XerC